MKELVALAGPSAMRNSLIFTGLTLRTLIAVVSTRVRPLAVNDTLPPRSPLKAAPAEVTWKTALTLAPGATGADAVKLAGAGVAVQPLGRPKLKATPLTGASVMLV